MTASAIAPRELALQSQGLRVRCGSHLALQSVSVSIAAGRWTSVIGPNGAGKSTLLKALAGLLPAQGQVLLNARPLSAWPRRARAQQLAWMGQEEAMTDGLTVWDVVMLGRLAHQDAWGTASAQDAQIVQRCLTQTDAWAWRHRSLAQLSDGERQRVLLARLLAVDAPLLLMDEPLTHLDPPHQMQWLHLVQSHVQQGRTVVSVLHEVGMALYADDAIVLQSGQVVHQGPCADATTRAAIESVFAHRIVIRPVEDHWVVLPRST